MDHLLNWLWQGLLVTAAAQAALRFMTRARAGARYAMCCGAIAAVLALPVFASLHVTPAEPLPALEAAVPPVLELPAVWWSSSNLLLAAWTMWLTACSVRAAMAFRAVRAARARVRPLPSALEARLESWSRLRARGRPAQLALSERAGAAAVLPFGRPIIAVSPDLVARLSAEDLDQVIVHEWAHVQRRDDVAGVAHLLVQAIAGWHPGIWWLQRQLVIEREAACDEMAIAEIGSAKRYALCLARTAGAMHDARALRLSAGVLSSPSLRSRVVRVLSAQTIASHERSWRAAAAAMVLLAAISSSVAGASLVTMAAELEEVVARAASLPPSGVIHLPLLPASAPPAVRRPVERRHDRTAAPSARLVYADVTQSTPEPRREVPVLQGNGAEAPAAPRVTALDAGLLTAGEAPPVPRPPRSDGASTYPSAALPEPRQAATDPQTRWGAAADAGAAIGRASQDAAARTSGFFTRFGRKIASSF